MDHDRGERVGTPERHVAAVVVALLLVGLAGGGMMMGPGMMVGGPLLLVGIVLLAVWLLRGGWLAEVTSARDRPSGERALDVLGERYARGELSDEQYEAMRRVLQRPPGR
jgi:putative membrane protein